MAEYGIRLRGRQMTGGIDAFMKDPDNKNLIGLNFINNLVAFMVVDPNTRGIFRTFPADKRRLG